IVINTSLDMLRKRNRGPLLSEEVLSFQAADDPREEVEREAEIALNYDKVIKAISSLPEGYKLVVNLYLVEGLDHKEVGEILGISESTSRSQLARAKKRLLEILQKGH
ncbi:MAG TPA: RNA polymerase sigma factor, partial [Williamwhitmania sp.]|nr:RNA polymerase sigma factor [Williamwhitmania sp.]